MTWALNMHQVTGAPVRDDQAFTPA